MSRRDIKIDPEPCSTCPYRKDTPTGIWAESEYLKLPDYDAPTGEQPISAFLCHHTSTSEEDIICRGWVTTHTWHDLLGLRMLNQITGGRVPFSDVAKRAKTPCYESGAEAAEAGMSGIEDPSPEAAARIRMLLNRDPSRGEKW